MIRRILQTFSLILHWPVYKYRKNQIKWSSHIGAHTVVIGCNISRYAYIGQNCCIKYTDIGSYSCISWNVMIGGMEHCYTNPTISPTLNPDLNRVPKERTYIGYDVWIGANCVIRQGVNIGNGAVIGAGSVVTHDIPEYSIAFGSPARVIKKRLPKSEIERIKETRFWELCPNEAKKYLA